MAIPAKQETHPLATAYLVAYNVVQTIGWSCLGLGIGSHFMEHKSYVGIYETTNSLLHIFQTLALLEVLHCVVGFVRSSVFLTGFQVASRIFLVWGILYSVPESQTSPGYPMLLLAWTVTEIIRYFYYVLNLCKFEAAPLVWLRYTLFYGLYPIGVTGELLCIYTALVPAAKSGIYSVKLPNQANFAIDYPTVLVIIMLTYIPVFPQLYFHMIAQRRKIISPFKPKIQ